MKRIIALLTVAIFVAVLFGACSKPATPLTVAELLDLGEKYLLELDYEQAVVQFLKVIEVEPMNPRGYMGAAEAYIELNNAENAIAILEQGRKVIGDNTTIADLLEKLIEPVPNHKSETESDENNVELEGGIPEVVNLTGKEPFALQDLEDWGLPWGTSLDDLTEMYEVDDFHVNMIKQIHSNGFPPGSGSGVLWNELGVVFVDPANLMIHSVWIDDGNAHAVGPRGLRIGMTMEDVINTFQCDNQKAMEFVKQQTVEIIEVFDSNGLALLYGSVSGWAYWYSDFSGDDFQINYHAVDANYQERVVITCYFVNRILTDINICYNYLNSQ